MNIPIRYRWPTSQRGIGIRKHSCYIEKIEVASTLTAKHCGDGTADCSNGVLVMECRPVLTPDRLNKRQNGRRMKNDGEPMFTLTAQDIHGVAILDDIYKNRDIRIYENECPTLRSSRTDFKLIDQYNHKVINNEAIGTLTASGNASTTVCGTFFIHRPQYRLRKLTPKEVWRLQGFPDEYFEKAKAAGVSDHQLYRQAGNAVSVNIARTIGLKLAEGENEHCKTDQKHDA